MQSFQVTIDSRDYACLVGRVEYEDQLDIISGKEGSGLFEFRSYVINVQ